MSINSFENYPMSWKPSIDKNKKQIYQAIAGQLEKFGFFGMPPEARKKMDQDKILKLVVDQLVTFWK